MWTINQKELTMSRKIVNYFRTITSEEFLGWLVLRAVQELIKVILGRKDSNANLMDGNADNYHELDYMTLDANNQYLVEFAKKLLRYGS